MNFREFQYARQHFLVKEGMTPVETDILSDSESQAVYEFLQDRYENEVLNEGLISSIVSWFRRNFSARASKIKKLGKEYYDWLMSEYNATYKKNDDDTPVEAFLKKEKISSDIEQQILDTASDHEDYAELAKKTISECKIRAKKDFCKKILGDDAELTRQYSSMQSAAADEVNQAMKNLSREDAKRFEFDLKNLRERIKKDGKKIEVAAKVAAGIMVFAQNRKLEMYRDYSPEELWKEYERGERIYLSVTPSMNNMKGAEYMFSIRASRDPDLMKISRLLAKQIKEEVLKINQALLDVGVDTDGEGMERYWGLIELYLKQRDPESQRRVLDTIREKVKEMTPADVEEFAAEVEEDLADIAQNTQDPEKEEEKVEQLEKKIASEPAERPKTKAGNLRGLRGKKRREEKWKQKQAARRNAAEPEKETDAAAEAPAEPANSHEESAFGPVANKLIETLIADSSPILEGMKDYIVALVTAEKKNDKYVWSPVAKATDTVIRSGLNDPHKGISPELIEQAKQYVDSLNTENPFESKFNERIFKEAAENLFVDYKTGLDIWEESLEKSDEETQKELMAKAFFAMLFKDKKGTTASLDKEKVKEHMSKSFEFYL